tara:strand:- start:583 stop:1452 length:870 start_codon:yes stop_codon:yes gene_type:complete
MFGALLVLLLALACGGADGSSGARRTVIQNKGSDTIVFVALAWAENYGDVNPSVAVAVTGGGSGTGISAMVNGTVDIANTSRAMTESEIEEARSRGIDPIEHVVGFDALAVFLHPDNPLDALSISQLAEIYAEGGAYEAWSDLGVSIPGCSSDEIIRVSRQNNSGTYAYFKEAVLGQDEYKPGSLDMNGSSEVVDLVGNTPCAIGYSGLAYATEIVEMPCILTDRGDCVSPSAESAIDGSYPIARPLFMYTAGEPTGMIKEYMDWILGEAGQCILVDKGFAAAGSVSCA